MKFSLLGYFDQKSSFHIFLVGLTLLVLVAILDFLTGGELSFSIFYLLPIVLVTWFMARWAGLTFCILAASTWLLVETNSNHNYNNNFIPLWNTLVRFSFFLMTTALLFKLKNLLIAEKKWQKLID
jgi:phosphoglycerol transferase MdoB-like AlkP superfamily enzyme